MQFASFKFLSQVEKKIDEQLTENDEARVAAGERLQGWGLSIPKGLLLKGKPQMKVGGGRGLLKENPKR